MKNKPKAILNTVWYFLRFGGLTLLLVVVFFVFSITAFFSQGWNKAKKVLGLKSKDGLSLEPTLPDEAWAEVPSCPYLYSRSDNKLTMENDVLMSPGEGNYHPRLGVAKAKYEKGLCGTDFLKLNNARNEDGKIKLRIKEAEPEESFFDGAKLYRVDHPQDSEVYVSIDHQKIFVIKNKDKEVAQLPSNLKINNRAADAKGFFGSKLADESGGVTLRQFDNAELEFEGLSGDKNYLLLLKTSVRGWSPAELTLMNALSPALKYALAFAALLVSRWWDGSFSWTLPLIMLSDGNRSIHISYLNKNGAVVKLAACHPRIESSWEGTEVPKDAIENGKLKLSLNWTLTHKLLSIGLIPLEKVKLAEPKECELESVAHSRISDAFTDLLKNADRNNYVHTIQGDTLDLVFKDAGVRGPHTYILATDGFYTNLRPQYQKPISSMMKLFREKVLT